MQLSRMLANDPKMEGIVSNECDRVGYPPNGISPCDAMSKGLTVSSLEGKLSISSRDDNVVHLLSYF